MQQLLNPLIEHRIEDALAFQPRGDCKVVSIEESAQMRIYLSAWIK